MMGAHDCTDRSRNEGSSNASRRGIGGPSDDGFGGRFRGDLPDRTFEFAKIVLDLLDELPANPKGWAIAKQLVRCGTSIGANVSEAGHALTDAEFVHRCSIARKEAAETRFWLRLCMEKRLIQSESLQPALNEVEEFIRVLAAIIRKVQHRADNRSRQRDAVHDAR